MLSKCYSGAINGVDASTVEIEVCSQFGTSRFAIVRLPDQAVKEAKGRIPKALKNLRRACVAWRRVNKRHGDIRFDVMEIYGVPQGGNPVTHSPQFPHFTHFPH